MTLFSLKKNDIFKFKGQKVLYMCVGLKYFVKDKKTNKGGLLFEYKHFQTGTSYYSSDNTKEVEIVKRKPSFFW